VSHTSKRVSHTLQRIDALIKEHRGRIQGGRLYALCHHGSLQVSWCGPSGFELLESVVLCARVWVPWCATTTKNASSYSSPVTVQILMSALSVPTTIVQIYAACFRRNSTKGLAYNFSSSSTAIRNSDECCISSVIRAVQPSHSAALNHFLLRKTISKIMRSA